MKYQELTRKVNGRLNPDAFPIEESFRQELSSISYSDVLVYIRSAMKSVGPEYTKKTRDAGDKAKQHLQNGLSDVSFRYQGSVLTDTHIRGHSDIDLLTISDKFYSWNSWQINNILNSQETRAKYFESSIAKLERVKNTSSYTGDSLYDLKRLRSDSEDIMLSKYHNCDISNPKSIKIKNLSLNRKVDIVVANWYDDATSIINDRGDYRGIQVYDKDKNSQGDADYPFLSIKRINERSSFTNGRLKKMIRFMKNVKADSSIDIDLSSFDINAICYDIDVNKYQSLAFYELVPVLYHQLRSICTDSSHSDRVVSVDGKEYIFKYSEDKLNNLRSLLKELESIFIDYKSNSLVYG